MSDDYIGDGSEQDEHKVSEAATKWNGLQTILEKAITKGEKVIVFTVDVKTLQWLKPKCEDCDYKLLIYMERKALRGVKKLWMRIKHKF